MKKLTIFVTLIVFTSALFMGCSKSESDPEPVTDYRDAWAGSYTETINGTMTINIPGQPMTFPISDTGSFRIEKGTSINRIIRIDNDTIETGGTINAYQVTLDPKTETVAEQGMIITATATGTGTLNGKVFTYTVNITGSASISGVPFPITGIVYGVATKK